MRVKTFVQEALTDEAKERLAKEREDWACSNTKTAFLFHLPSRQVLDAITIANYRRNAHELIWEYHKDELHEDFFRQDLDEVCIRLQYNPYRTVDGKYVLNDLAIPGLELSELYEYGYRDFSLNGIKELVVNKLSKQDLDTIERYIKTLEEKRYIIQKEIEEKSFGWKILENN